MKISSLFEKKAETKQRNIDIREAFTLWDILNSKYMSLEKLLTWMPFTNDAHLKLLIREQQKALEKNIKILEDQMRIFSIPSPGKNKVFVSTSVSSELISDEFIAADILFYEQEHAENLLYALYSSMTNDGLRDIVRDMLIRTLELTDKIMTHASLRGWTAVAPTYKHRPATVTEDIHCGEAGCLWDLLIYRYDTVYFSEIVLTLTHDMDLKLVLETGIELLKTQIKRLEKELAYFGIPVPKRPPEVTAIVNSKDLYQDSHIFRSVMVGMQGAASLHAKSLKKSSSNKRIRGLFKKILIEEVEHFDDLVRYGKLKGWLHDAPLYGP
jgi:hypothetical protein